MWLTRRRAITLAVVALLMATGIVANHVTSRQRFLREIESVLPLGTALSADLLHDWVVMRESQVQLLAQLASDVDEASSNGERPLPVDALAGPLRKVVARGGFSAGAILDTTGTPPRMRVRRQDDSLTVVDFLAPIAWSGTVRGWVVLSTIVTEQTFSHFNVADPSDKTQRTLLVQLEGDSLVVLTASAPGGAPRAGGLHASVPQGLILDSLQRRALVTGALRPQKGTGRSMYGSEVIYARAPVPGTPWLLIRERNVDELLELIRRPLAITDVVFTVVGLLALGTGSLMWRSAFLRRVNESAQLRSTFVSGVSHELRTPLTQIRMYAEMLRMGLLKTPDESARALSVIEKEAQRLSMLVDRALTFTNTGDPAALKSGAPATLPRVEIARAFSEARDGIAAIAAERGNVVVIAQDTTMCVRIAPDDLHQILLNLLDNAIKYGPAGQHIRVSAHRESTLTRIDVEDEGPGVPMDEREVIWKSFSRGQNAHDSPQVGSGIGLAIVRELATAAGGRSYVTSRLPASGPLSAVPSGARFVVELPSA